MGDPATDVLAWRSQQQAGAGEPETDVVAWGLGETWWRGGVSGVVWESPRRGAWGIQRHTVVAWGSERRSYIGPRHVRAVLVHGAQARVPA